MLHLPVIFSTFDCDQILASMLIFKHKKSVS